MEPPELLRSLLAEYTARFEDVSHIRLRSQRALTRRFLTHHARASVTEFTRVLLRQEATGEPSHERGAMLRDLRSFQDSLRPPLSTFARTLILLVVLLVAQLLGRLPLIPIVEGPDSKPALGSLSEAVDIDPGHVAKAIGDLLGSPPSTILGAVATLSAAAFLMLGPAIPAYRRMRKLVGAPSYSRQEPPKDGSIEALERELFKVHPAARPQRRPFDLFVIWSLAILAAALGLAWYRAYSQGLLRETLSPMSRRELIAELRTRHPRMLGIGGVASIAGAIVVSALLSVQHPGSPLRRLAWIGRSRAKRVAVVTGTSLALASLLVLSGMVAFALPGKHSYRDPMLEMQMTGSARQLIRDPVIGMDMRCRPAPCAISAARIDGAYDPLDPLSDGIAVQMGRPIKSLGQLPTKKVTRRTLRRDFGRLALLIARAGRRIAVPRSELVEVVGTREEPWADQRSVFDRGGTLESGLAFVRVSSDVRQFVLVLADRDLARLLAGLQRGRVRLDLNVTMGKTPAPHVSLPVAV